jgi:quinolinate synthase
MSMLWQQPLPPVYLALSDAELRLRVQASREALGSRVVILGHHYQQDAVVRFADYVGDSFELSRYAARQNSAEFVVFCGVHFMAESADILTAPSVRVVLPDLGAGCSMADMAGIEQVEDAWAELHEILDDGVHGGLDGGVIPITYMNSSAALKAFVGRHHGAVCTSSNCQAVLQWALRGGALADAPSDRLCTAAPDRGAPPGKAGPFDAVEIARATPAHKVLFFPDQHLGRNTAYAMGHPLESMIVWDPHRPMGGNTAEAVRAATFILWKGHCSVHALFRPEHVDAVRRDHPGMKVIVHPECKFEVVTRADLAGSTAFIVDTIRHAPPGSKWAIGTEVNLVHRLKQQHPEQQIVVLSDCQCMCTTMFRVDLPHLCWALEQLAAGRVVNEIRVSDDVRKWSLVALDRMLALRGSGAPVAAKRPDAVPISTKAGIED